MINVVLIVEVVVEVILVNGLLCCVGVYFYDIGKMLKFEYFVEN